MLPVGTGPVPGHGRALGRCGCSWAAAVSRAACRGGKAPGGTCGSLSRDGGRRRGSCGEGSNTVVAVGGVKTCGPEGRSQEANSKAKRSPAALFTSGRLGAALSSTGHRQAGGATRARHLHRLWTGVTASYRGSKGAA